MINIKIVESAVNNKKFMDKYIQGKKHPLNFCCFKIKVDELANGEYNYNYKLYVTIEYKDKIIEEKSVLRINYGSQMHLDNQVEYEYNALEYLRYTGVTPVPVFLDTSKELIEKEYLVMNFIEGGGFDYTEDMVYAAECLAKIHSYKSEKDFDFVNPDNPFAAMIDECRTMYGKYENSRFFNNEVHKRISRIFESVQKRLEDSAVDENIEKTLINTELNSSNFIMNGEKCFLVDWEKPIIGEKEQDLGHFLAPTTTFWKTDIILSKKEIDNFMEIYYKIYYNKKDVSFDKLKSEKQYLLFKEKVYKYIVFNCLRGLTWCAMAWVEYNDSEKTLVNEFTYNKLKEYLKLEFMDNIIDNFIL